MTRLAWANLLFLSLIWGAAFTFSGVAVREVGFATVVFLRVFLALLALAILLGIQGKLPRISKQLFLAFLIMGLINNLVPFSLLFWAQSPLAGTDTAKISSGLASIFNALTPFFAMLTARFVFSEESLSIPKLIGVGFGIAGVTLLFLGSNSGSMGENDRGAQILGMLACVVATISYGFGAVFGRRFFRRGLNPTQGAFGQLLGSSLLSLPLMLILDQPWTLPLPSTQAWVSITGLALVSTALAYVLYFWLIEHSGAVNAALVTLLIPASALVLGALFLDEKFGIWDLSGLGFILFGLLVIDGRLIKSRLG